MWMLIILAKPLDSVHLLSIIGRIIESRSPMAKIRGDDKYIVRIAHIRGQDAPNMLLAVQDIQMLSMFLSGA